MDTNNHLSQFYSKDTATSSGVNKPNKRYLISSKNEIAQAIRKLTKKPELITVFLEKTNEFLISAVLEVDDKNQYLYIDDIRDAEKRQNLLASKSLTITSQSNGIKLLFPVNVIGKTVFENRLAIKVGFPEYLLKLQRREFFRSAPPIDHGIKCQLKFDIGNINIDIADISEGGISLVDRSDALYLKPDMVLKSCKINLPNLGTVESDLKVQRIDYAPNDPRNQTKYIGCEYINPSNMMTSIIRRYVLKIERYNRSPVKVFN